MLATKVIVDADGSLGDIADKLVEAEGVYAITALEAGMISGKPSVGFVVKTKDGNFILAQTSMEIFLTAAKLFKSRYNP